MITSREVCISGFASLSREWANELPESVEVWAMNEAHYYLKRKASRWFQLHPKNWRAAPAGVKAYSAMAFCGTCGWGENGRADVQAEIDTVKEKAEAHFAKNPDHDVEAGTVRVRKNGYGRTPNHLKWLKQCGVPVYQMKIDDRIPTSVKYPYDEIVERYGHAWITNEKRPYLTSTVAYMLALALYEHENGMPIDKLYLAGVELAIGTEYFDQRPCVEYWIGRLEEAGIEYVPSPYGQSILNGPIYAREHSSPLNPKSMGTPVGVPGVEMPVVSMLEDEDGNAVGF